MPRKARIDAADAVHHIMVRGIEQKNIFDSNKDRDNFLQRLSEILQETETACFAWSLMPNHFHLLCRTGNIPISGVMQRLLTGYAVWYNRSRQRHGHLFQNRFKSILCQTDAYLLELVRYIHLNPLRAGMITGMTALDRYQYSGHITLMGNTNHSWQNTKEILSMFGKNRDAARRAYRKFIEEGIDQGKRSDLSGGGLIRSAGGWTALKAKRNKEPYQHSDERILGDSDFVNHVLKQTREKLKTSYALRNAGVDLDKTAQRVSKLMGISTKEIWAPGKLQQIVNARSLLCFWAVRELEISMSSLAQKFGLSIPAVSKSVTRGKQIAEENNFRLIESETGN